jgi:hypothetical protein
MTLFRIRASRAAACIVLLAGAALGAGCSAAFEDTGADAAEVHAKASAHWKMILDWEGSEIEHPLERLDIFIFDTDDPERYPETFELRGDGVTLVGTLPVEAQVGYGEELERLVGKTVPIGTHGGDPHEQKHSSIRLAGMSIPVTGGSTTFRRVTGKWSGRDGDKTVWGTLRLDVQGATGVRTLEGAFAVPRHELGLIGALPAALVLECMEGVGGARMQAPRTDPVSPRRGRPPPASGRTCHAPDLRS